MSRPHRGARRVADLFELAAEFLVRVNRREQRAVQAHGCLHEVRADDEVVTVVADLVPAREHRSRPADSAHIDLAKPELAEVRLDLVAIGFVAHWVTSICSVGGSSSSSDAGRRS
jgi:hypothetical protein